MKSKSSSLNVGEIDPKLRNTVFLNMPSKAKKSPLNVGKIDPSS